LIFKFGLVVVKKSHLSWEKQLVGLLYQEVQVESLNLEKEDRWVWKEEEVFGYKVKSVYHRIRGDSAGENVALFKKFWKVKVVPSAIVTAWRV